MGRFDKIFKKGRGEDNLEVNDTCLAALKAAGEVIHEKCKFTPSAKRKI